MSMNGHHRNVANHFVPNRDFTTVDHERLIRRAFITRHELILKLAMMSKRDFESAVNLAIEMRPTHYPEESRIRDPVERWSDDDWFSC